MIFDIDRGILFSNLVTNWYHCVPAKSNGGSLTGWISGALDCSVAKVEVNGTGCDVTVPERIVFVDPTNGVRLMGSEVFINYEGWSTRRYPTHEPRGTCTLAGIEERSDDPRGAIYIR